VQQVKDDLHFLAGFRGLKLGEKPPRIAAVAGATLTSYAILEAVQRRLGQPPASLKFTEPPTLSEVQSLFPTASSFVIDADDPSVLRVRAADESPLGWILRTSPAADNIIGYQGPTDVLIGFSAEGKSVGVVLRKSYDNEPYVGYVRDDDYFRHYFDGKTITELSQLDLKSSGVEGVSGATMTSLAVAKGLFAAAQQRQADEQRTAAASLSNETKHSIPWNEIGSVVVVLSGISLSFSRWRGEFYVRLIWQGIVIGYLGLFHGTLLAQALFVGWAQNGVPLNAIGLICLALAAITMPIFTKRNVYCSQLCPHGAVQQLTLRWIQPRWQVPTYVKGWLLLLPAILLLWCLLVGMLHWPFSLVDIEPFDAYIWRVAGGATLAIAIVGIVASCFVPMAYCKYGCPTGALLEYLRFHARSERWTRADSFALVCLLTAISCLLIQRAPT
jgi:Na+-translocating ferredoxin:NAD+ oxidoreductase RnfG subunit